MPASVANSCPLNPLRSNSSSKLSRRAAGTLTRRNLSVFNISGSPASTRGLLAEFIVAKALDAADGVRIAWDAFDVTTRKGTKVEVKSAAYLQSWEQTKFSTIQFNVEKTTPLDEEKGSYRGEPRHAADVYVFAVLAEQNKSKVDPMNLDQWEFYVAPTKTLEKRKRSQQSITLNSLINEKDELEMEKVDFSGLKKAVERAAM
jgi:hypothetical protein